MMWLKPVLLVTAPSLLALGIVLPLLKMEKLYFFSENPSLIEIVAALWRSGDSALACLVFLLSVAFPAIKLVGLSAIIFAAERGEAHGGVLHRIISGLSRWAMMDVVLVALVIFAAKSSGLASATTQPGLWCYAGSALCAALLNAVALRKNDAGQGVSPGRHS